MKTLQEELEPLNLKLLKNAKAGLHSAFCSNFVPSILNSHRFTQKFKYGMYTVSNDIRTSAHQRPKQNKRKLMTTESK